MSSILTNNGASTALATLRSVNDNLSETQSRISTGLAIRSGKDNAAYFSIAKTMEGDSGMYKAIQEGMTLTKNTVSTSRMGAEKVAELTEEFASRVAFAQGGSSDTLAEVGAELEEINKRIDTTIEQASFNGQSLIDGTMAADMTVVTGITRSGGFGVSTTTVARQDLSGLTTDGGSYAGAASTLGEIATAIKTNTGGSGALTAAEQEDLLEAAQTNLATTISAATDLGVAEKTLETQQDFLSNLTDQLDSGVGAMVDANMEEEAARLQALQVQQQLSVQALSIANQAPQNIMSLFR